MDQNSQAKIAREENIDSDNQTAEISTQTDKTSTPTDENSTQTLGQIDEQKQTDKSNGSSTDSQKTDSSSSKKTDVSSSFANKSKPSADSKSSISRSTHVSHHGFSQTSLDENDKISDRLNKSIQTCSTSDVSIQTCSTSAKTIHDDLDEKFVSNEKKITNTKGEKKKATPAKGEKEKSTPAKGEKEKSTPAKGEKEKSTPAKGEKEKFTPAKGEKEKSTPAKGEKEKSTPAKDEKEKSTPAKDEKEKSTPAKGEKEKSAPAKGEKEKSAPAKGEKEKSAPAKGEKEKSAPAKGEKEKSAPAKGEKEKSAPAKGEKEKSAPAKGEKEKSAPAKGEKEKSAPAKGEKEKSAPAKSEKEKSAPTKGEKEKSAPAKGEKEKSAPAKGEKEKSAPAKGEKEKSAPAKGEKEKSAPAKGEKEKSAPAKGEKEKSVPAKGEKEKSVPAKGEKEKSVPAMGEKEKSVPAMGEKEKSVPAKGEKEKSVPAKGEKEKSTPAKGEKEKSTPAKGEKEKSTPAKGEKEKSTPAKGEKEKSSPAKGEKEKSSPAKGEKEKSSPAKGEKEKSTPAKGEKEKSTPAKSEKEKSTPAKSEKEKSTPAKSEKEKSTPTKGEKEKSTPSKGEKGKITVVKDEEKEATPSKGEKRKASPLLGGKVKVCPPMIGEDERKKSTSAKVIKEMFTPVKGEEEEKSTPSKSGKRKASPLVGGKIKSCPVMVEHGEKCTPTKSKTSEATPSKGEEEKFTPSKSGKRKASPLVGEKGKSCPVMVGNDKEKNSPPAEDEMKKSTPIKGEIEKSTSIQDGEGKSSPIVIEKEKSNLNIVGKEKSIPTVSGKGKSSPAVGGKGKSRLFKEDKSEDEKDVEPSIWSSSGSYEKDAEGELSSITGTQKKIRLAEAFKEEVVRFMDARKEESHTTDDETSDRRGSIDEPSTSKSITGKTSQTKGKKKNSSKEANETEEDSDDDDEEEDRDADNWTSENPFRTGFLDCSPEAYKKILDEEETLVGIKYPKSFKEFWDEAIDEIRFDIGKVVQKFSGIRCNYERAEYVMNLQCSKYLELWDVRAQKCEKDASFLEQEYDQLMTNESNYKQAISKISKCLKITPIFHSIMMGQRYRKRAFTFLKMKKYEEAFKDARRSLEYHDVLDFMWHSYEILGHCYAHKSICEKAEYCFDKALKGLRQSNVDQTEKAAATVRISSVFKKVKGKKDAVDACYKRFNYNDPEEMPKVSNGYHEKIECASSLVSYRWVQGQGRGLYAAKDIKPGDTLVVEKAYVSALNIETYDDYCCICFKRVVNPIPCSYCSLIWFCSEKCLGRSLTRGIHKRECAILPLLYDKSIGSMAMITYRILTKRPWPMMKAILRRVETRVMDIVEDVETVYTIRDKYTTNDYYNTIFRLVTNARHRSFGDLFKKTLSAVYMLKCLKIVNYFKKEPITPEEEIALVSLTLKHFQGAACNAYAINEYVEEAEAQDGVDLKELGGAIHPTVSLTNHSCSPNTFRYYIDDICILRAMKVIKTGDQIYDNYGALSDTTRKREREDVLAGVYKFQCKCKACEEDWPQYKNNLEPLKLRCPEKDCTGIIKYFHQISCLGCPTHGKTDKVSTLLVDINGKIEEMHRSVRFLKSGEPQIVLPFLKQFQIFLDKYSIPPSRVLCQCQESLKRCFLLEGNVSKCLLESFKK